MTMGNNWAKRMDLTLDELISAGCNLPPTDDDDATYMAIAALLAYVEDQSCYCSEHPQYEPCQRCSVLGQRNRERVLR